MLDEVMMEQNGASPSSSSSLAPSGRPQNAEHDARDPSPSKRDFPHGFCAWGDRDQCIPQPRPQPQGILSRDGNNAPRSGETSEQQTCPCCPGLPAVLDGPQTRIDESHRPRRQLPDSSTTRARFKP